MNISSLVSMLSVAMFALGCAQGNCRNQPNYVPPATAQKIEEKKMSNTVKVYKPDGSLQCGMGKSIPLADMQKDLKDIAVKSSYNKNDGMMRIQVCGSPTGNCNVYEIDRENLEKAIKMGFKEWTFE